MNPVYLVDPTTGAKVPASANGLPVQMGGSATGAAVTGSVALAGDTVVLQVSGAQWATVRVSWVTFVSQSFAFEISIDGGTNWVFSAMPKRIDVAATNPSVVRADSTTVFNPATYAAASSWEVALPANATNFRVRAIGAANNTVTLQGLQAYVPGEPVTAVLYDQSNGAATNSTPVLDVSGWSQLYYLFTTTGTAPTAAINEIDDAGNALAYVTSTTAATNYMGGLGVPGLTIGFPTAGLAQTTAVVALPKRMSFTQTASTVTTSRWRIVARR